MDRRTFLKAAASSGTITTAYASYKPGVAHNSGMPTLNVSQGQDISNELESAIGNGETVVIPGGSYQLSNLEALSASVSSPTLIEGDGMVTLDFGRSGGTDVISMQANGTTLTYRNITIVGTFDGATFRGKPQIPNGGEVRLENWHFNPQIDAASNVTGLMFDSTRGDNGTVYFEGGSIWNCGNNGIYHSQEINVRLVVRNSEFRHNNSDHIRVGGRNDLIEGNVFIMEHAAPVVRPGESGRSGRAVRMHEAGDVTVRNNDVLFTWDGSDAFFVAESGARGGSVEIRDNRILHDGDRSVMDERSNGDAANMSITGGGNQLTGSNTSTISEFDHVVACRGSGCEEPRDAPGGGDPFEPDHTFAIIAESEGPVDYTMQVSGDARHAGSGDLEALPNNDEIIGSGDGVTIEGFTGNAGYGDTYEIEGEVTSVTINTPESERAEFRLERDGNVVTDEYFGPDISETYNGTPKADYYYCGGDSDVFEQWQALEISTAEFQDSTSSGQGTEQVQTSPCETDEPDNGGGDDGRAVPGGVIGLALLGGGLAYKYSKDREN